MTAKRFNRVGGYVYDGDKCISHFEDVSHRDDIVKLLNELHEENERLLDVNVQCCNDYSAMRRDVLRYKEENEQLRHDATILIQSNQDYRKENEQLKQRNDRQAKQLDRLYQLISEKDWRTLTDIMDDFKKAEEQLQREWRTYK